MPRAKRCCLVAASLLAALPAMAQGTAASVTGTWRIVRILPTGNVSCWDETRARTLVGSTLRYAPHSMTWQGGEVPVSEAIARRVTTADLERDGRVSLRELGIASPATTEIDLQHEDADVTGATTEVPGDTILLAGPRTIVVSACGVYYRAVRVRR